jgi:uncharacterized membrane protein YkvA (DUF1232 family)
MIENIRAWARALKREITVLAAAVRDPRTPWPAKLLGVAVVAYALSPIDLIPDFIPVLGFVDDAILLPLGIWAVRRMIPAEVYAEHQAKTDPNQRLPSSTGAAIVIAGLWIAGLALTVRWLWGAHWQPWISSGR